MLPAACSRTPKCRLRPPRSATEKSPACANVISVFVEGARSADPPTSHGTFGAIAFSTLPEASRPAMPLPSVGKVGRSASHPSGSSRFWISSSSAASFGCATP